MTNLCTRYFVQCTNTSGQWHDVDQGQVHRKSAEVVFIKWANLKSDFFCVRLILRDTREEELLLDFIQEKD